MGNNYIEASKQLHSDNKQYGAAAEYSKPDTMKFMLTIPQAIKASQEFSLIRSILDHGTGKGGLIETLNQHKELDIIAKGYDPCVPEFSELPSSKFDIVTSIDVLEHLGIDYVGSTISEINNLTENFFFFCIDLVPASKMLNDGRNAHTLIAPSDWWLQQIKNKFKIISCIEVGKMSDGSSYPMHLFGCASNSRKYFKSMNAFLDNVEVANYQWIRQEKNVILKSW